MEPRKAGYCCISKLKVNSIDKKTGGKVETEVIELKEIRDEMKNFYQDIFAKQTINEGEDSVKNYLNLDDDIEPLKNSIQINSMIKQGIHLRGQFYCKS